MSDTCDVCGDEFGPLSIKVEFPMYWKGVVSTFYLCRLCFLEANKQGNEWKPPIKAEVPAK